jgi:hypothetical protein
MVFWIAIVLCGGDLLAQMPPVAPQRPAAEPPNDQKGAPAPPTDEARLAELREKREKAQGEAQAAKPGGVSEATQEELQERRARLEQIVRGYDEQLSEWQRLKDARQRHADITRTSDEWKGFADPPPSSILFADQLWDAAYALRLAVDGLQSQLNLLTLRFDHARDALTAAEERLRQSSERLESAKDPAKAARERWLRDLDQLRRQAASVMLSAAELSKQRVEEELADTRARLAFSQRQLEAAEPHATLSDADLNKVRARLAQERQRLEAEWEQTIAERRTQADALQAAERRLDARLPKKSGRGPTRESPAVVRAKAAV